MSLNQLRFAQHTAGHDAETPKHARSVKTRDQSQICLPKGWELGTIDVITNKMGGGSERGECGEG